MRAVAELTARAPRHPGGPPRLGHTVSRAPIAWRSTPDAVYLVGTAASPVGDDDIELRVVVEAGACLRVRSSASTIVWASTAGSRQRIGARVDAGAVLDWHPEPLIATAGCDHVQQARVDLAPAALLRWTDEVVLGRHGEQPGALDLRLDVDVGGRPLLRHALRVGRGAPGWDGPAVLGAARCAALRLVAGTSLPSVEGGSGAGWAVLPLAGPGALLVAVGPDLPAIRAALTAAEPLLPRIAGPHPAR